MPTITNKEKQVLALIADGLTTKEIGVELNISFYTVETHRKKLLHKFEVKNSAQLIVKAITTGVMTPGNFPVMNPVNYRAA